MFEKCNHARYKRRIFNRIARGIKLECFDFTDYLGTKEDHLLALARKCKDPEKKEFYTRQADYVYRFKMDYLSNYLETSGVSE